MKRPQRGRRASLVLLSQAKPEASIGAEVDIPKRADERRVWEQQVRERKLENNWVNYREGVGSNDCVLNTLFLKAA